MTEQPGLRERKKRRTSRRIEEVALDLFDRDGFDATTIETIAAAADIAPRTFFYYFPTKEDVVLADYTGRLERIVEELHRRPAHERPWAALRASFLVVAADYEDERDRLIRRFRIMASTPSVFARSLQLQAGWEDAVTVVLAARMGCEPDEDMRARLLASAALTAIRTAQLHWVLTGQQTPLPSLVDSSFDMLAAGLADLG